MKQGGTREHRTLEDYKQAETERTGNYTYAIAEWVMPANKRRKQKASKVWRWLVVVGNKFRIVLKLRTTKKIGGGRNVLYAQSGYNGTKKNGKFARVF
jgi:hypothetical protein